ncbi:MAG: hypothetical protein IJU66_06590 [Oscillospiraceae bacterium]|nr:hypothetical protein [Oscillospiraceae bacterium]
MKFYQKLDGGVLVSAREYDVASDAAIAEGQVVKLSDGLVVSAAADETGAILGIAAESHSGAADVFDPRADGTKILVIDDPDVVMQCAAPKVTALAGSATTLEVTALKSFAADDFNGGYVKLLAKADGSTNTDPVGRVRRITDFALDGETPTKGILTVESGGAAYAGDVYAVFPPVGFSKGGLNSAKNGLVLTSAVNLPLKVIGHDKSFGTVFLVAKKHVLAVGA